MSHCSSLPCFDGAVRAFFVGKDASQFLSSHIEVNGSVFSFSRRTEHYWSTHGDRSIVLFGFAVDSRGEWGISEISDRLLTASEKSGLSGVLESSTRLAGTYVVFYHESKLGWIAFPDPTGTLPVFYDPENNEIASHPKLIADQHNYRISVFAKNICIDDGSLVQFPYDLSEYDEIKALLPNHLLFCVSGNVQRYSPYKDTRQNEAIESAVHKIVDKTERILKGYSEKYDLCCPLTSGYDSRVVYALAKKVLGDPHCYTIKHGDSMPKADVSIPYQIAVDNGIDYAIVEEYQMERLDYLAIKEVYGPTLVEGAVSTDLAHKKACGNGCQLTSNILDQIGKSGQGGPLSGRWATSHFFAARTHLFEQRALHAFEDWVADAGLFYERQTLFDIYCIEGDCGRWGGLSNNIASFCGHNTLNPFNCNETIAIMMSVSQRLRAKKTIHKAILTALDPQLLQYPFNPESKTGWMKEHSSFFLLGVYGKYALDWLKKR